MRAYIPRRLAYEENGERKEIADTDVLGLGGPVVVLGEPGMGKTRLLEWIAEQAGTALRSAGAFVRSIDPRRIVMPGVPLVLDALDQMAEARRGDTIQAVATRLGDAGAPPFILSCRANDWRASMARGAFGAEYRAPPRELTLLPFSRDDVVAFLTETLDAGQAAAVAESLEARGLGTFLDNPLTLGFVADIARRNGALPNTRAELVEQAVDILRRENDDGLRDETALATLGREDAFDAAGALCAAFLLGGREMIARTASGICQNAVLLAADVGALPGAGPVDTILGSRLFKSAGTPGRQEPIHRTVAEYLGARWLARQAQDHRARDRIHALMVVDGGVPASLRGLHAWLAHWPEFCECVIEHDPLGLLIYGDTEGLAPTTSRRLLAGLRALEATNPGFRDGAGRDRSMRAFTQLELVDDVRTLLRDDSVRYQLRSTVLEAIGGSPVAAALSDEIEAIALAGEGVYTYVERSSALSSLAPEELRQTCVCRLIERAGVDDTRLALEVMASDQERFEPATMATALLGHLGFLPQQVATGTESFNDERRVTGVPFYFAHKLSGRIAGPVLDEIAAICRMDDDDWSERKSDLWTMLDVLISKAVSNERPDPRRLLAWLKIAPRETGRSDDWARAIAEFIRRNEGIRRGIQRIVLLGPAQSDGEDRDFWALYRLHPNLHPDCDDLLALLDDLAEVAKASAFEVAVWQLVVTALRDEAGLADEVAASAGRSRPDIRSASRFWPKWRFRSQRRSGKSATNSAGERFTRSVGSTGTKRENNIATSSTRCAAALSALSYTPRAAT